MVQWLLILCNYIAEGIIAWQYFNGLFTRKRALWFCILSVTAGYGAAYALFNFSSVWLNTLFFVVLNFGLLLLCFQCSWRSAIFHAGILTSLVFVLEMAVEFILGQLFGGFSRYQSDFMVLAALAVFSKLLLFAATRICIHIASKGDKNSLQSGPAVLFFSSFPAATAIILLIMAYTALTTPLPKNIETLMVSGSVILLFSNLMIFLGYQHDQDLNQEYFTLLLAQQKDEAEANYLKVLEDQFEQQRVLIHDIKRHLTALHEIAEESSDKPVAEYVSRLMETPALQRKVRYCANPMLNIVMSLYGDICAEKGISFHSDIRDISLDFLSPEDITSLFGNLLENAVEAAEGSAEALIELRVDTSTSAALILSLVNSCKEMPNLDATGDFISHKTNKARHGVGQKSIRNTVKSIEARSSNATIQKEHNFTPLF